MHRTGLAFAGHLKDFSGRHVQICGRDEISYVESLSPQKREKILEKVFRYDIPCIIVAGKQDLPDFFVQFADRYGIPVFTSPLTVTNLIRSLGDYMNEQLAPRTIVHGSMVDVYGIGILITGRSGIGKSEIALDLVSRGHRLVADDQVTIVRKGSGILMGMGNEELKHYMEIRGVGILNVEEIYGIRGVRKQKRIELLVELADWDNQENYERLGLKDKETIILGEKLPLTQLPVYPGKNISVIVEVIALNHLLKISGRHMARDFEKRLVLRLRRNQEALEEKESGEV
jgi:HPr kinase/phosphorylase